MLLAPRLLGLHLLAVAATTAAILLGVWQFQAWQTTRIDQAASLADAAPRPLEQVFSADAPFPGDSVGRPVDFSGRWLPAATMYVADRTLEGRSGFWAVTPVEVCDDADDAPSDCAGAAAMLVVRGWVAQVGAAPPAPGGTVDVTGWLQPGEGSGVRDDNPADDVIPELRIADALQQVDQDLYGGYVIAEQPQENGLAAVTPASLPEPDTFTALRNLLYAVEWWVFGAFAVFLWTRWCRDEADRVSSEDAQVAGVPSAP